MTAVLISAPSLYSLILILFPFILVAEETWMKKTAVWCRHYYGSQWYFDICWKFIFVTDFMNTLMSLLCGTEMMTYAVIVPNWFLLKLKVVQLSWNRL